MSSVQLILASSSPRRKKLLSQIGLSFRVIASRIEEIFPVHEKPAKAVQTIATQKAESVAEGKASSLIIAADTVVVLDGNVLGQPANQDEAKKMLSSLSNKSHNVYTGVAIIRTDKYAVIKDQLSFYERTKVTFATLDNREIDQYIQSGSPMDKAGAYGIQDDLGALFVSRIEGDYYNVVGLPLHKLYKNMKAIAPEIINHIYSQET
jgi:septum formation protein